MSDLYDATKIPDDLRSYFVRAEVGLERTPDEYVSRLVEVFREVRRVLRGDGTLWLVLGDSYCTRQNGSIGASGLDGSKAPHSEYRRAYARRSYRRDGAEVVATAHRTAPGLKHKDLIGVPWRVAFALQADGWYLRSEIIWHKCAPMPESVRDRPTKSHEYLFLLAKLERYYYDAAAISEPATCGGDLGLLRRPPAVDESMVSWHAQSVRTRQEAGVDSKTAGPLRRNARSVWTVDTQPYPEAHFATFPEDLIRPCILAGCPPGGVVLDPFMGSGTTAKVARDLHCRAVGIELNPEYINLAARRLSQGVLPLEAPC